MLLSLGMFGFELKTMPYESLRRATQYDWSKQNRVGLGPDYQFTGQGDDTISLSGALMPELTGGAANLAKLREMAATGKAWLLTSGTGDSLGRWIIKSISDDHSAIMPNGLARRIGFSISLERYYGDDPAAKGDLKDSTG